MNEVAEPGSRRTSLDRTDGEGRGLASEPSPRRPRQVEGSVTFLRREIHAGPLPAPQRLRAYRDVDERLVPAILDDAAQRRDHRQAMELGAARYVALAVRRGQILALLTMIAGFASAILAEHFTGSTALAVVLALVGAGAPVTMAFRRTTDRKAARAEGAEGGEPPPSRRGG